MLVEPSKAGLNQITDLVESSQLKVTIDSVYGLDYAKQDMIKNESASAIVKIVIEVS